MITDWQDLHNEYPDAGTLELELECYELSELIQYVTWRESHEVVINNASREFHGVAKFDTDAADAFSVQNVIEFLRQQGHYVLDVAEFTDYDEFETQVHEEYQYLTGDEIPF